jgi:GSH-dependent disulfide-bond oxidoreductase
MSPIDLYYWPTPNGWKISILLEELALPYNVHKVDIGNGDQFKPEFLAISPNNRMPAIVDHESFDGQPLSVFESGAIMQYLAKKHGKLYGSSPREAVAVDQWLMWQMGGVGPMAGQCHHFRMYAPEKVEYAINRYTNEVSRLYGVLNKQLADKDYITGSYSIADIAVFCWAKLWERQGQDIAKFPHMEKWIARINARPAVITGLAVNKEDRKAFDPNDKARFDLLFKQTNETVK